MTRQQFLREHLYELVDVILVRHSLLGESDGNIPNATPEERRQMADLVAALRRVAAGTYDTCGSCGQRIGTMRRTHDPTTDRCEECVADSVWRPGR